MMVVNKVRLCAASEVKEGEPVGVFLENMPALAVYCVDGAIYVTDNTCTHGNAMLSEGYQDGGIIECPFHGSSEERRVGKECVSTCRSGWSPEHLKKKK